MRTVRVALLAITSIAVATDTHAQVAGDGDELGLPARYEDPRAAVTYLRAAREREPDRFELHVAAAREGTALGVLDSTREARLDALREAAEAARHALALDSTSVDANYWLAAALGLQADEEGGATKIRLAREAYDRTLLVLEADSLHGGANHILGRLHKGVRRLNFLTRLIARGLGLGPILGDATWESAERHMRIAVEQDPDDLVNAFELGKMLVERERVEEGRAILTALVERSPRNMLDAHYIRRAADLLDEGPALTIGRERMGPATAGEGR